MADLSQYLKILGAKPDATLQEISTVYYLHIEKFPENPTEEEEEYLKELQHAFSIVRRAYAQITPAKKPIFNGRVLVSVMIVLAVLAGSVFAVLNASAIQIMLNRHEVGDVLRWESQEEPYGEVVSYDPAHKFHAGPPSPAYEIRLAGRDETIWIGERLAVKGMVKVQAGQ